MKNILSVFALVVCLIQLGSSIDEQYFSKYKGYTVYKVIPKDVFQLKFLKELEKKLSPTLNFWNDVRKVNAPVNVMVDSNIRSILESALNSVKISFKVVISDVADSIIKQRSSSNSGLLIGDFDYSKYHTLQEIHQWIDQIAQQYPKYVSVLNITQSFEGRTLKAFKISVSSGGSKKPALWFDGGIHAREWISPATVIFIGYSLLSKYGNDANVTEILNTFDIYILPVFNVDGYVYTFTNDRLWRKTRSKTKGSNCVGADPNRNWDIHWCEQGASSDPCDDTFCGVKPFSEIEVKGVADFLGKNNDTILCYINFHSYSQLWMSPYGYASTLPKDFKIQDDGSVASITALFSLYKTEYDHGNIADTIYVSSGSSVDWTYDKANILYSYAVELRDQGEYGFLLPEDQIIPTGLETFEAVKALAYYIKGRM